MNYSLDIAQITKGSLHGRLSVKECAGVVIAHLRSNQGLIFNGDVNSSVINFAIESSNNIELHRVQGIPITNYTLSGFKINKKEHYFSITPGSCLYMIFFPKKLFLQTAFQLEGEKSVEFFHAENFKPIHPKNFNKILNFARQIAGTSIADSKPYHHDYMIAMLDALISSDYICTEKHKSLPNHDLVYEFVKYAFAEGQYKPLTIDDLTTNLFSSKTVLSTAIRKSTGLSPMVFLRNLRLQQVQSILLESNASTSVIDIAAKYGFSSRGHFSRYYKDLFGELPSQTLTTYS